MAMAINLRCYAERWRRDHDIFPTATAYGKRQRLDSQSRFYLSSVVCKLVIVTDLGGCTTLPGPSLPDAGRVPCAGGEGVDGVWPSL